MTNNGSDKAHAKSSVTLEACRGVGQEFGRADVQSPSRYRCCLAWNRLIFVVQKHKGLGFEFLQSTAKPCKIKFGLSRRFGTLS